MIKCSNRSIATPPWRFLLWTLFWTLFATLPASASWAQSGGEQNPAPPEREAPSAERAPAAAAGSGVDRSTFTPSEEVSPDREVDFPADI